MPFPGLRWAWKLYIGRRGLHGRCLMLMLKSCPRCRGDLYRDRDQYGWFLLCLHCGYMRDLEAGKRMDLAGVRKAA